MVDWYESYGLNLYTTICLWGGGIMLILFSVGLAVSSRIKELYKGILAKNNSNKKESLKNRYKMYNSSEKCLFIYGCITLLLPVLAILPILFALLMLVVLGMFCCFSDNADHVSYTNIREKDGSVTSITSRTYVDKKTGKTTTYRDGYRK